ncbi:MAG: class A beta-lactamase [Rhodanobacter sp.]
MNRRDVLKISVLGAAALAVRPGPLLAATVTAKDAAAQLAALESKHGGRLGVAILDTHNGHRIAHRGDERFLMCSTFKLLLVAAVLARVDGGVEKLGRRIVFDKGALLGWAPVTGMNVGAPGMTVQGLCEAAVMLSDNTAANVLLEAMDGPASVTAYVRSLGDKLTRLDHNEPLVNQEHGEQDTTTPWAMLQTMQKVLLEDALSEPSRAMLMSWLALNQTGAQSLRAGLPTDWRFGDKTGASGDATNDVAIVWPPHREPLLVTAYYRADKRDSAQRKAVLADVGSVVASLVA